MTLKTVSKLICFELFQVEGIASNFPNASGDEK